MQHHILSAIMPHAFNSLSSLHILILLSLKKKKMHGYLIMAHLKESIGGCWEAKSGSIYPALAYLESKKLIKSRTDPKFKLRKRVYGLTNKGEQMVDEILTQSTRIPHIFQNIAGE